MMTPAEPLAGDGAMTTDDLRTRAREAAEKFVRVAPFAGVVEHERRLHDTVYTFVEGALWHAAQQPSREQIRNELAHWPIGHGYEPASVSIDDAGDMADAVLALFAGAGS